LIRLKIFREPELAAGLATSALVSTVLMATLVVGPFLSVSRSRTRRGFSRNRHVSRSANRRADRRACRSHCG
jgi:hypothetical protein